MNTVWIRAFSLGLANIVLIMFSWFLLSAMGIPMNENRGSNGLKLAFYCVA